MSFFVVSSLWRCVWVPRFLTLIGLILGLPMFLRMPPWVDITLYDMAARTILAGGCHYRDLFDTNPPGFVWALTAIRAVFGPSYEALWLVDLGIVVGILLLIDRLAKWGGASPAARWWVFAGVAFFYPFSTEGIHGQRDVWMSLPALAAVVLRVGRTRPPGPADRGPFWPSLLEGVLWALAVWVKPHVMVMAAGVWLLTVRRVAGERFWRTAAIDFAANMLGGIAIGLAGVVLLVASGSWDAFLDVFTTWNQSYSGLIRRELSLRYEQELHWFPPWSLFLLPTIPLAVLSLLDARPWSGQVSHEPGAGWLSRHLPRCLCDRGQNDDARFARAVLAGCFLVWSLQSLYLQRGFQYVHVVETFLMLGLWASHRWMLPALVIAWITLTGGLWLIADANPPLKDRLHELAYNDLERDHYLIRHPLADPNKMKWWAMCWRTDLTPRERGQLRDGLKHVRNHEASIGWEEMEEVAEFLRSRPSGMHDGDVIAWHDSPHAIYLLLGKQPGIRFMHTYTIISMGPDATDRMLQEVAEALPKARYIVGDLYITTLGHKPGTEAWQIAGESGEGKDLLPPHFTDDQREDFPFTYKPVFRSRDGRGRYVVFRADDLAPPPEREDLPNFGPGLKPVLDFLRER